ncbi:ABC transporter ATP-binding protein/permease [Parachlamydia acanthamoebae]|uniref:ABC transporter ATP-binding protein/permease n=1 Tax=Parachlamydia acanthamoebae TaxID=83552 RepID=UPI0007508087|nr:ABC transporter ATP-binding protein/permease [Parachlamydia acanthamoebae]
MNSPFPLINNKWIKATIFTILIQQLLVAGGTYFLGLMINEFPVKGFQLNIALIIFFCILLPGSLFHYLVVFSSTLAGKQAQLNYLTRYIKTNYNHPTHWRNEESKNQRHTIMCRGGQDTIQSALHFFIDSSATTFNIIFNTISIILVTDLLLGLLIIFAGSIGLIIIHFYDKKILKSSREEMLSNNRLNAHLSQSWDNIILGNQLFFNRWHESFDKYFLDSKRASVNTVKNKDWAVFMAALTTNGLVLGGAFFLAWFNKDKAGFVLAIMAMLPRCLQIVMHMQIIQTYVAQWKNLKEKLTITMESLQEPQPIDLSALIKNEEIKIQTKHQKFKIQDMEKVLKIQRTGRFTITGPNGAGKSSLLLSLKNKIGLPAIYLPAQHQLQLCNSHLSLSSGEIALSALTDLKDEQYSILMLDEWDANLSTKNRSAFEEVISQLSLNRVIVEIRHFSEVDSNGQ